MPPIGVGAAQPYSIEVLGKKVELASPLSGAHQHRNTALAVAAAVELNQRHGFPVSPAAIAGGVRRTRWPGRLERMVQDGVDWILDVAHNPAGAWSLRAALREAWGETDARPRVLVFNCLHDKPVRELAQILFPLFKQVIFPPIHSPRATPLEDLLAAAEATGTAAAAAGSVAEALQIARSFTGAANRSVTSLSFTEPAETANGAQPPKGLVVISGSVYLVGEAREPPYVQYRT